MDQWDRTYLKHGYQSHSALYGFIDHDKDFDRESISYFHMRSKTRIMTDGASDSHAFT